ncbi:MAG TPA: cation:proton antiporter [Polyangia bacterium]|nr:cation:proton antiporter [Polyangia bacterium]
MRPHGFDLLTDLALIMCVAAATTALFQRLRQPVVLGYILAGLLVGPHTPFPLFADEAVAHQLSELGVILLMFSLGLEFSLRKVVRVAPTAGVVAVIECSLMVALGYLVGRAFGWSRYESLFSGAAVAISSTTIIVKAFGEQPVPRALAEMVFGILVFEDLIAILLLAVLTALASGAGLSAGALARVVGKLAGFLAAMLVVGMAVVPRLLRAIVRLHREETTVVATVGICFAFALLARWSGYSVALGAFLGGALAAESGAAKILERRIEPVRDVFAAVFFVSVGMLIEPRLVWAHAGAVLALTALVVAGKLVGVSLGSFVAGNGVRSSVQAALSMGQIGEFSFIIEGVGLSLGVTGQFLYPVAVAVSALTTLLTPFLIRVSGPVAAWVDRRLPHTLQTYAALYGDWVQRLRASPQRRTAWSRIRRLAGLLVLDAAVVVAIIIAASLLWRPLVHWSRTGGHVSISRPIWVLAAVGLLSPFVVGAVRLARALGVALAAEALPAPGGTTLDLAAASRRALLVTLQIAILLVVGAPVVAVTQLFVPGFEAMGVLLVALALSVVPLWRSADNLQGHVRAGAEVLLEALASQSRAGPAEAGLASESAPVVSLPGLGHAQAVRLARGSPAIGQSLRALALRGLTGATVIAIEREPSHDPGTLGGFPNPPATTPLGGAELRQRVLVYPTADETLRENDALIVTGTAEAVEAARAMLDPPV